MGPAHPARASAAGEDSIPAGDAYHTAGVSLDAAAEAKRRIFQQARTTFTQGVLGDIGAFGALFQVTGYQNPVLVSHIDNVGTKLRIATLVGRFDTVGEDLVHHCVNDIFTCGARPLFFLDYIGAGDMVPERVEELVQGMARACRNLDCALVGGETAELPGLYQGNNFDLVGFVVGAVEREKLIDGHDLQPGDLLLGLPSSGLHTNGFSLARRVFDIDARPEVLSQELAELGTTLGDALLAPHRCYYPTLAPVLGSVKAMAHITGGGLIENVPRILPSGLAARFDTSTWQPPPIFRLIQQRGGISEDEMYRVFNMGIGMVVSASKAEAAVIQATLPEALVIGDVVERGQGEPVHLTA